MHALKFFLLTTLTALAAGCKTMQTPANPPQLVGYSTTKTAKPLTAEASEAPFAPQLVMAPDGQINAAVQAAWPMVQNVLSLHRCVRMGGLGRLNQYAVAGEDVSKIGSYFTVPNADMYVPNHDLRKCLSVRQVDNWEMPALNTLNFRAVFHADDSGESVNMRYTMRKVDDGSWRLLRIYRPR